MQLSTWKLLLLPWFLLRLGIAITPSVARLVWPRSLHLVPLLPAVIFSWLIMGGYWSADPSTLLSHSKPQVVQASSQTEFGRSSSPLSPTLLAQIEYWQAWYQLQPTHRDVLLNLAELYRVAGDSTQAEKYLHQAQQVDPNYPEVRHFSNKKD